MADHSPAVRLFAGASVALFIAAGCSGGDDRADVTDVANVESSVAGSQVPAAEADTSDAQISTSESLSPDDRPLPVGDEPAVLGPLGETEVEIQTDDGVVQIGAAEVPVAVASVFPIPDGLEILLASEAGEDAGFSGVTVQTFDELVAFYEAELPGAGYESTQTQFVDDVVAVYEFAGPNGAGNVAISSAPGGGRSVLVTFQG